MKVLHGIDTPRSQDDCRGDLLTDSEEERPPSRTSWERFEDTRNKFYEHFQAHKNEDNLSFDEESPFIP